ncbi:hypothetical protein ACJJID_01330 [Microbulbifer sp. CnH-101-G]|uniref:hypothetical protein n=1 Tax=Microbulbifer sp. CnH-101-G TaxID=3243393 RepID=UPI0040393256
MNRILLRTVTPMTLAFIASFSAQSTLAVTDNEDSIVTLQFNETINMVRVGPLTITDPATGTNATGIEDFCVRGTGFSTFAITFDSTNGSATSEFILSDGTTDVPYQVGYDNSLSGSFTSVSEGVPLTGQAIQNFGPCVGFPDNARFQVTILNMDWENSMVLSGNNYTDTLMLTVESE